MKILHEAKTVIFQDSSTNKLYRYNPEDGKYYELNMEHSNSSNSSGQFGQLPDSKNKSDNSSDDKDKNSSSKESSKDGEKKSSDKKSPEQNSSSGNDKKEKSSSNGSKDSEENSSSQVPSDNEQDRSGDSNKPLRIGDKGNKAKERSRKWDEEETEEQKQERLQRVSQIKRLMDNPDFVTSAVADAQRVVKKKREKASSKGRSITIKNINEFQPSLNRFIKSQIIKKRGYSYAKPNKKYNPEDILKPGRTRAQQTKIPRINVYFDVSGSWGPEDIELGKYYISILNGYEQQKKIIVDLYYFANRVSKNPGNCGGGTDGQPILDHIVETGPDNVIVMTDGDINDCTTKIQVPGGVWFLWRSDELYSKNLYDHLSGAKVTESFSLEDTKGD